MSNIINQYIADNMEITEYDNGTVEKIAIPSDILVEEAIPESPTFDERINTLEFAQKSADEKYKELDVATTDISVLKSAKMAQLDEACNTSIVSGFDYMVNGISYKFSCSLVAQANFQGTDTLFKDAVITTAEWTVINNATGKTERIIIDQATFNNLKLQVFQHINTNISKFRNTLQPQVESATTNSDVNLVIW